MKRREPKKTRARKEIVARTMMSDSTSSIKSELPAWTGNEDDDKDDCANPDTLERVRAESHGQTDAKQVLYNCFCRIDGHGIVLQAPLPAIEYDRIIIKVSSESPW